MSRVPDSTPEVRSQLLRSDGRHRFPLRLVTLAVLTAGLIALSVLISLPFLHAITWGVALAIMSWPMHKYVRARVAYPSVAAALSTMIVLVIVVLPSFFAVYEVGREVAALADKSGVPPDELVSRQNLQGVPGLSQVVAWMDRVNLDVETEIGKLAASLVPAARGLAEGSISVIIQFLAAMFILFFVFRDHREFEQDVRDILPLTRAETDRVLTSAADSVYANLYATFVTGVIDAGTGMLLFWALGLPTPVLWGVVMLILSILPVLGVGLIWVPMVFYLALTGRLPAALAILTWGVTIAIVIDYMLYAKLAGDRMRMHPVPALIAFLGGLAVFGLSGMILGPAIVAITSAVLDLWREKNRGTGSAMADAA